MTSSGPEIAGLENPIPEVANPDLQTVLGQFLEVFYNPVTLCPRIKHCFHKSLIIQFEDGTIFAEDPALCLCFMDIQHRCFSAIQFIVLHATTELSPLTTTTIME